TMAGHAPAFVAQDRMDPLAASLGAALLAAIRFAEFSLLLRSGKHIDRNWFVAGESSDFFLGGLWITFLPDALYRRSGRRSADGKTHHRRHRIHVRFGLAAAPPPAQLVSRSDAAAASVGDLASRLRPARMETPNADGLDRTSNQLSLAARAGCELGSWAFLS